MSEKPGKDSKETNYAVGVVVSRPHLGALRQHPVTGRPEILVNPKADEAYRLWKSFSPTTIQEKEDSDLYEYCGDRNPDGHCGGFECKDGSKD